MGPTVHHFHAVQHQRRRTSTVFKHAPFCKKLNWFAISWLELPLWLNFSSLSKFVLRFPVTFVNVQPYSAIISCRQQASGWWEVVQRRREPEERNVGFNYAYPILDFII